MSVVVVGSVRGAPGVTTIASLIAGAMDKSVLVEADLTGGVLAVRYQLGREPGLTSLAADRSTSPQRWTDHAQSAGGVPVLVGPDAPATAQALWRAAGDRLAMALRQDRSTTAIADVGRFDADSPLVAAADLIALVVRPVAEHLVGLGHRLDALRAAAHPGSLAVLVAGPGPYRPGDIAEAFSVPVLGHVPEDRRAAAAFEGGALRSGARRSRLARSAWELSHGIVRTLSQPQPAGSPR